MAASPQEQILFFCLALRVAGCTVAPSPPPPPPYGPLTPACEAAIRKDCTVAPAACGSCIRHSEGELITAGCPPARQRGFERCLQYCQSEAESRRDEAKLYRALTSAK